MTTVAVTGGTGRLGGRVARRLSAAGAEQLLLVRDPSRAPQLTGATAAVASFADREAVRAALEGVSVLLMVSASESADRVDQHRAFVDSAAAAGVPQIVYVSFYGAAADSVFTLARDHWATEQHIRASGMGFTFLRDNLYADVLPALAGEEGVIRGPAGDGRVAAVAQDDVADVATAVVLDPVAHAGRTYSLTGPESLTLDDVAGVLTEQLGRPVRYVAETVDEAYASRQVYAAPQWQLDAWVSTYTSIASGEVAQVTDDILRVTGHPPMSLAELVSTGRSAY